MVIQLATTEREGERFCGFARLGFEIGWPVDRQDNPPLPPTPSLVLSLFCAFLMAVGGRSGNDRRAGGFWKSCLVKCTWKPLGTASRPETRALNTPQSHVACG